MSQVVPLRLKISNAYLIKGDKPVLVDTGSPKDLPGLIRAIEKIGTDIRDLSLIVHTHAHFDHCGCTAHLQDRTDALVAIHRADAQAVSEGRNAAVVPIDMLGKVLSPFIRGQYRPVKPDIVMADKFDLHPYGVNGIAFATPGHTAGSISILLDGGEAIVGDLIGGGRCLGLLQSGRPRFHHWYADIDRAKASICQVMKKAPSLVYVGHGGPLEGKNIVRCFGCLT